jgi:hypothetical protein
MSLFSKVFLIGLMAIGSVALWIVNPIFWLWLASKVQESQGPGFGPYLLVLAGIAVTMVVIGKGLGMLNRAYGRMSGTEPTMRVRMPWHRSLRGERDSGRPRTVLDVVMVVSVSIALFAFVVWFFVFAGSSLPT